MADALQDGEYESPTFQRLFPGIKVNYYGVTGTDPASRSFDHAIIDIPGGKKYKVNSFGQDVALTEEEDRSGLFGRTTDPDAPAQLHGPDGILTLAANAPRLDEFKPGTDQSGAPDLAGREGPTARGKYGFLNNDYITQNHLGIEGWKRNAAAMEQNQDLMKILKTIDDEHANDPSHQRITQMDPDGKTIRLTERGVAHLQADLKKEYQIPSSMVGRTDDLLGTRTITSLKTALEKSNHGADAQAVASFASRPPAPASPS